MRAPVIDLVLEVSSQSVRIAHLSDLHVYRHTISPLQLFSKQWIGNLNVLLNRRFKFHRDARPDLLPLFSELNVKYVVISGDMSCTSLPSEFSAAKQLVDSFLEAGMEVLIVPGNHDNYTKRAFKKKKFYRFFGEQGSDAGYPFSQYNMAEHRVSVRRLGPRWWWVGLDTTVAAGMLRSNGVFDEELEARVGEVLAGLPKDDFVVMTNHFPLTTTHPSHDMKRLKALRALLSRFPQTKLYLHGHVHRQGITDGRPAALPLLVNSGSCGLKRNASCNIIDLLPQSCRIQLYRHTYPQNPVSSGHWELQREAAYGW